MLEQKDYDELGGLVPPALRERLEADLAEVLSGAYFRFLTAAEWERRSDDVRGWLRAVWNIVNRLGTRIWRDNLTDILAGEGQTIMAAWRFDEAGTDPRVVAQYWALTLRAMGRFRIAGLIGPAGFDAALSSADDLDELWFLTGFLTGYVASRPFPVLREDPYEPMYRIYRTGVRPRLLGEPPFAIDVPLQDGGGRCFVRVGLDDGAWRDLGRRSAA